MSIHSNSDFEVIKACYQLELYLKALNLPVTVRELYDRAYRNRAGAHYDPAFLINLDRDERLQSAKDEPYTTQTIIDTLIEHGYEPLIRVLLRETKRLNIGFMQAYMMGIGKERPEEED